MKWIIPVCMMVFASSVFAQKGRMRVDVCTSNRDYFTQDKCRSVKVNASCEVYYQAGQVTVISDAWIQTGEVAQTQLSAAVEERAFQAVYGQDLEKKSQRVNLKPISTLIRGMVELSGRGAVRFAEIWVNHDSTGAVYTRYRCR